MDGKQFKIGIVGGMGPMAGVHLQKLIIENTPAKKDQDHLQVVCFTNPRIVDRTESLRKDGGDQYLKDIIDSIRILEKTGVDCVLIPCNTAHARFADIAAESDIPLVSMIEAVFEKIAKESGKKIGVLATDGTIRAGVFEKNGFEIIYPRENEQAEAMRLIYEIKAGKYEDERAIAALVKLARNLERAGAEKIVLGCTELSLYSKYLDPKKFVDPLLELAKKAILLAASRGKIEKMVYSER